MRADDLLKVIQPTYAYTVGQQAAKDGLKSSDNPYPMGCDQHIEWEKGWYIERWFIVKLENPELRG